MVLRRSCVTAQHRAMAGGRHPDGHHGCRGNDASSLTDLVKRRVEPYVRVLALDRTGKEGLHVLVQDLADPRDLAPGDPVDPERLDQVVHLAGGHALDVGLDDDGLQRLPARRRGSSSDGK